MIVVYSLLCVRAIADMLIAVWKIEAKPFAIRLCTKRQLLVYDVLCSHSALATVFC